ncbi:MAG: hypothetical protein AB7J40_06295 [Candidatus Altimarinota bacterium]
MNYPSFDREQNVFEIKTEYTEEECNHFFPFLDEGFYRLDRSLFLVRIEGFGAIIQSVNESEIDRLSSEKNIECDIKKLPLHLAAVFESHLSFYKLSQIMESMHRMISEGYDPEMN